MDRLREQRARAIAACDQAAADVEAAKAHAEERQAALVADLAHGRLSIETYEAEKAACTAAFGKAEQALEHAQAVLTASPGRELVERSLRSLVALLS